ncbi:ComEC/Rec2 family competence protein [Shimia sp. R11_0]|uniref:ComEC/Rec2 family competence protein n=1 Tax=Shimia sp. R11_0 TaxID=2821096 RepID=UPI001FFE073B|nr:ComEC/Rec2 family competence protein [Shimia sp. R11_0]
MRIVASLRLSLLAQRGHLFCWVPVCLAMGIGLYFVVSVEPSGTLLIGAGAVFLILVLFTWRREADLAAAIWALALIAAGFSLAGARAHGVAGPVLQWRYYGPIEGRVVKIDRSASEALRLTLAQVRLGEMRPDETPRHVRVALHGAQIGVAPAAGMLVGLTGHLAPPSGPVEPGGFDFQRHAWFQKIGAVGYTRSPVVRLDPTPIRGGIYGLRMWISAEVQARMPQDVAGVAAAITTGDRSTIPKAVTEALRGGNLAHLLAISGLHMGLLAGFVFGAVRFIVALFPWLGLRVNGKKIAAGLAMLGAGAYLVLSGSSVSTERAFVMTAVVLLAVLLDRRALTLRAVALAAVLVLMMRPEALLGPGFQMSFAATAALVGVFGWIRDSGWRLGPWWLRPIVAVMISSLVAGLATAPIAAMHFNLVAHYGLLANVISVPVMGLLVMPSAVIAAVLAPLGLEALPLWVMTQGLRWILSVAAFVSGLEGAQGMVKGGGGWALPLLAMGGVIVLLWQGRGRWGGVPLMLAAALVWVLTPRPDVLISDTAGLVGVLTDKGRALSKPSGQGFVARNWLENDGVLLAQEGAAKLWEDVPPLPHLGAVQHVVGKRGLAQFAGCAPEALVISSVPFDAPVPCQVLDVEDLKDSGAIAVFVTETGVRLKTARQVAGRRLWNDAEIRAERGHQ